MKKKEKIIIYQLLVRLAGNTKTKIKPWGTKAENGCGTFNDLTQHLLDEITALGANHIWLTGVLEHASCTGYPEHKIPSGHPLIIKGQAGSPYAIRDYFDVSPDLAEDVGNRMSEFESLVDRCHQAGLAPIIDFVPNHVAREYHSDTPEGKDRNFGAFDKTDHAFHPDNNYYYFPDHALELPPQVYDQPHAKTAGKVPYREKPAKATGNDCFSHRPGFNDWYETAKLNYGIDFTGGGQHFFDPVPDTWKKMLDVLLFWAGKKIKGFRCDMAEMVPVNFWEWCIPKVRKHHPDILFIAEIYDPALYKSFIDAGFDYLYDKVGLYDAIRSVLTEGRPAPTLQYEWKKLNGLDACMLRFMENHDEQRIASTHFAGDSLSGIPAMTVAATMHQGPVMLYFGQETGEPAAGASGYSGDDGRTSIFDYCAAPTFQKWYNRGACNEVMLNEQEKGLRAFYQNLLKLAKHPVISEGSFYDLMWANGDIQEESLYTYIRWDEKTVWLLAANFSKERVICKNIRIPEHFFDLRGGTNKETVWIVSPLLPGFDSIQITQQEITNEGIPVKVLDLSSAIVSLHQE